MIQESINSLSLLDIARGKSADYSIINKVGVNTDIDTGTLPEDITEIGGVYAGFPLTSLETVSIVSTNTNDTSAGTGARTITIIGLDNNYNPQTETITLNGLTPVVSVNQYRRIHTAFIASVGSGNVNAGVITCNHSTTTANVFFSMRAGLSQTNVSAYTIPAGYSGYLIKVHGAMHGTANDSVDGYLWIRSFGGAWRARRPFTINTNYLLDQEISGGIMLPEKTDIIVRIGFTIGSNITITAGYDLVLVRNQ